RRLRENKMEQAMFRKMLASMSSGSDTDIVMGLRAVSGHFEEKGVTLVQVLTYANAHVADIKRTQQGESQENGAAPARKTGPQPLQVSGIPQCRDISGGRIEILPVGAEKG